MSEIVALGPRCFGAEVLVRIAHGRLSCTVNWQRPGEPVVLEFDQGRPVAATQGSARLTDAKELRALVRSFGAASVGRCALDTVVSRGQTSPVDTLGEALVAVLENFSAAQLDAFWSARGAVQVSATPLFERMSKVVSKMARTDVTAPPAQLAIADLVRGADEAKRRAYAALLILGALSSEAAETSAGGASDLVREITEAHVKAARQNHYEFLGVPKDADVDAIRKAYYKQAKLWHSDKLARAELGPAQKFVEDLFLRAEEANRVLCNPEERKTYDWVIERKEHGLPTDPDLILSAEALFVRARQLVKRGLAAKAEPLLREALEANKGEAEFWAYFGFAVYSAQGKEGLAEAKKALEKALELRAELDITHEFLGKIARVENDLDGAERHFRRALELNPNNVDAQRELRLSVMRNKPGAGKTTVLGRLFKKS